MNKLAEYINSHVKNSYSLLSDYEVILCIFQVSRTLSSYMQSCYNYFSIIPKITKYC